MSRLLDALRHLQQPSDVKRGPGVEKVTPRLAASIRRAVLANEPAPVAAPVLFRVPDAAPAPSVVVTQPLPQVQDGASDPMALVDSIEASLRDAEPAPQKPQSPPASEIQRPQPAPGERQVLELLADPQRSASLRNLLQAARHDTKNVSAAVIALLGLDGAHSTGMVAAALALLLAEDSSRKILAVEADPEHKQLATLFGRRDTAGLSESLSGRANTSEVILPTSQSRLDLLTFGQASSTQAQLLPEGLAAEVEALRAGFGAVVVDAGSLSSNWARAASLAADAVYLLVRLGDTAAESAMASVNRFRAGGGKLTGCIAISGEGPVAS